MGAAVRIPRRHTRRPSTRNLIYRKRCWAGSAHFLEKGLSAEHIFYYILLNPSNSEIKVINQIVWRCQYNNQMSKMQVHNTVDAGFRALIGTVK
jgi:hypothetical protein